MHHEVLVRNLEVFAIGIPYRSAITCVQKNGFVCFSIPAQMINSSSTKLCFTCFGCAMRDKPFSAAIYSNSKRLSRHGRSWTCPCPLQILIRLRLSATECDLWIKRQHWYTRDDKFWFSAVAGVRPLTWGGSDLRRLSGCNRCDSLIAMSSSCKRTRGVLLHPLSPRSSIIPCSFNQRPYLLSRISSANEFGRRALGPTSIRIQNATNVTWVVRHSSREVSCSKAVA